MIASLTGKVKDIFPKFIILDVNGIGYKVEGIASFLEIGAEIDLFIYTHYTQQDTRLFGFLDRDAFLLFIDLLIVPGIGPRSAAGLINNLGADQIKTAILNDRPKDLVGKGIGPKTAQKIVLELAQRIQRSKYVSKSNLNSGDKDILLEVEEALLGLGYNKNEINTALSEIKITTGAVSESVLRQTLNILKKNFKVKTGND